MRSIRIHAFALVLWTLMFSFALTTSIRAQEKEKQKPGTTVDAWRQALPPEAEAQKQVEEMPGSTTMPSHDETQKTLLSIERGWMESLRVGDADSLSQIIPGDFTFANPHVIEVMDRAKYLEHSLRDLKLTSYEFDKTTVRLFGRTAIVSGLLKQKATIKGEDWGGNYLFTDVWIRRDGIWRVVSRHESPLPEQR